MMNTRRNADAIRQLMKSPVWADDGAVKLYLYCLAMASHNQYCWRGRYAPVRAKNGKSALLVQGQAAPQDADAGSAGHSDDPIDPQRGNNAARGELACC